MDISNFHYKSDDGFINNAYYIIQIGNFVLSIYVGMGDSNPVDINLDINKYKSLAVEVSDSDGNLLDEAYEVDFGIRQLRLNNKNSLVVNCGYMSYYNVTVSQLETIYNAILKHQECPTIDFDEGLDSQKVGGKCSKCGINDPWAAWIKGKAFCYKHLPGY